MKPPDFTDYAQLADWVYAHDGCAACGDPLMENKFVCDHHHYKYHAQLELHGTSGFTVWCNKQHHNLKCAECGVRLDKLHYLCEECNVAGD